MTTTPNDPTAGTGTENLTTDQKLALFLARVEECKARFDLTGYNEEEVSQYVQGWTDVLHYLAVGELPDDEAISRAVRDLLARGEGE